jgi:rhodanese-related sulfurtransferase
MFWKKDAAARPAEIDAAEVGARPGRGGIALVDAREPNEIAAERIPGAISVRLSQVDPGALPKGEVVLTCLGGQRSAMAKCRQAGVPVNMGMRGGLTAWKAAGLPTVS